MTTCKACGSPINFGELHKMDTETLETFHERCVQATLTTEERESMIEWLTVWTRYDRLYWEKQDDATVKAKYEKNLVQF